MQLAQLLEVAAESVTPQMVEVTGTLYLLLMPIVSGVSFLSMLIRTIHYTIDGGYNWSTQLYQYDSLPLHDIHLIDSNTGCAVGEHGVIFWTTDGGSNWVQKTSGTVRHLWGVFLLDANTAWAVGVRGTIC